MRVKPAAKLHGGETPPLRSVAALHGGETPPLRSICLRLLALALLWLSLFAMPSAHAEGFPGQGDINHWSDALPYFNRGNKRLNEGRYEAAADDYHHAISIYEFDPDFYVNLGICYRNMKDYESAQQAWEFAAKLNPKDWAVWMDLANAHLKQNQLPQTLSCFKKSLALNPPPADKEVIEKDIKDIEKILSHMQKTAPTAAAKPGKRTPNVVAKSGQPRMNQQKTASSPAPANSAKQPDAQQLQQGGWDYLSK